MTKQSELYDRAAECEQQMKIVTDPVRRQAYMLLRDMWIMLANGSVGMSDALVDREIAMIEKVQATAEVGVWQ
jgi:hypothetical protein